MFVCPENDDQQSTASCTTNPKSILLTGKAGIGKSLFCRKLTRDWSHNRLFEEGQKNAKVPDFQFVFLLTFRQLVLPEEKLNLCDILNLSSLLNEHSVIDEPLLQYMIDNPEKLLIILDGYDEYKPHREKITRDFETRYANNPDEKIPVPALIAKIMKGKMLNGAVVLISSRPEEAEELKEIVFDVRCDIQGFSSLQVLEYIQKYFKENESMKNKVLDHIKKNEILLSFGHIPVMCFLMCYYIKWHMTKSKTTEKLPVTRTELYHEVIKVFIKKHCSPKYEKMEETKVQEILHKLAELAVNLMMIIKPLEYIYSESSKPSARVERWVLKLQPYHCTVKYIPGPNNIADALSRLTKDTPMNNRNKTEEYVCFVAANATPAAISMEEIKKESAEDKELIELRKCILSDAWET
ncbi:protein NLRC5-like [Actinia tenebrosa]|uniref:Protein NLRC5-like n=1 Tax=Actinia tenebrosa TaxID=6105 RepID=A0A6P8H7Z8_ACTTE|nr:protein NLRC5-like [Actinia tenebrosa]